MTFKSITHVGGEQREKEDGGERLWMENKGGEEEEQMENNA